MEGAGAGAGQCPAMSGGGLIIGAHEGILSSPAGRQAGRQARQQALLSNFVKPEGRLVRWRVHDS